MSTLRRAALLLAVVAGAVAVSSGAGARAGGGTFDEPAGGRARELYLTGCGSCHGVDGDGVEGRGPTLEGVGGASAYYYLSTGRMPLADVDEQPRRKEPAYTDDEISLLVDYVASLGRGPKVPDVDLEAADLAEGGVLYRSNCAPCHAAAGIGGALSYGRAAPSLSGSDPAVIASAMRVGPGQMPAFGPSVLTDAELDDVVRYVRHLQSAPTPGGAALGGAGPLPEGFVAWVFGIGTLLLAALWMGRREVARVRE